ncbi:phosphatase PAP2 family protein [Acidobacteria bacterium AH-259-O06]|nr:phosphatase PAP2 family protein [Acidobacteria bacterium AH-259-O06]
MRRILPLCLIFLCSTFVYGAWPEVELVAPVLSIDQESEQVVLLKMSLGPEFDITVRVTDQTEIKDEGEDPIAVSDLMAGVVLKVEGLLTNEGVLAQDIEIAGDESDFSVNAFTELRTPGLAEFPRELTRNFKGLFSKNNLNPLLIGLGAAGVAAFFDHKIHQPQDGFQSFQTLGQTGKIMGKQYFIVPAIAGLLVVNKFYPDNRFHSMSLALTQGWVLNNALTYALKFSSHRRRPNDSSNLSFPSGHASNAFMWATVASQYYGRKVAIPAYATAVFIGCSRIANSAHYMSDVIAGAALGYIVGRTVVRGLEDRQRHIIWLPSVSPDGFGMSLKFDF